MNFLARIDRILGAGGMRALTRAVEAGHAGMPQDASLMEHARLIICLEGKAVFQLKRDGRPGEVELGQGDGLFVGPGRWVRSHPRRPYVSMGIVFYADATRFYLMSGNPQRGVWPGRPSETFVVPAGLAEDARALPGLLAGSAPLLAAERFFRSAAECLLIAARELLATPPHAEETGGKAHFTWRAACDFIRDHLHRPLSRKDVARHLGVHPSHVSRLFAEFSEGSLSDFLQAQRLERARLLMADPRLNIAEVARLSGFASANYFTRVFRARTGRTPTRSRGSRAPAQSRQASPK